MLSTVADVSRPAGVLTENRPQPRIIPRELKVESRKDLLTLGKGDPISPDQAMNVVVERALDRLRAVVDDARTALGLPDNAPLDTSPEATGNRIADFALGAFGKWRERHKDLADDEARTQFVDFIGAAVQQGIAEARNILGSLNALNPEVNANIDKTWDVVQQRFNKFLANES